MEAKKIATSATGIETYELSNDSGMSVQIITFGARIHKLFVPDRDGKTVDVVAGFDDPEGYRTDNPYFNAVIGRVVNRIGNARFSLNGKTYELYKNDNENCLHGGKTGFDSRIWTCENCSIINGVPTLVLTYFSPDGEENFPGNMKVTVTYTLNENTLGIEYFAETDLDTPCNLTNHAYFNLDGDFETAREHIVFINSHLMTESDEGLIATGKILDIKDTPFDFSSPKTIGRDTGIDHPLLKIARNGYDFNYILEKNNDKPAAYAYSEKSGIKMTVFTDRPCLQLYTGNFLDGSVHGKKDFGYQSTFCMETQGYPNACNIETFPSIIITKDKPLSTKTKFAFEIK